MHIFHMRELYHLRHLKSTYGTEQSEHDQSKGADRGDISKFHRKTHPTKRRFIHKARRDRKRKVSAFCLFRISRTNIYLLYSIKSSKEFEIFESEIKELKHKFEELETGLKE